MKRAKTTVVRMATGEHWTVPYGFGASYAEVFRHHTALSDSDLFKQLDDRLRLVGYTATPSELHTWSFRDRVEAMVWAMREHLIANGEALCRHPKLDWFKLLPWQGKGEKEGLDAPTPLQGLFGPSFRLPTLTEPGIHEAMLVRAGLSPTVVEARIGGYSYLLNAYHLSAELFELGKKKPVFVQITERNHGGKALCEYQWARTRREFEPEFTCTTCGNKITSFKMSFTAVGYEGHYCTDLCARKSLPPRRRPPIMRVFEYERRQARQAQAFTKAVRFPPAIPGAEVTLVGAPMVFIASTDGKWCGHVLEKGKLVERRFRPGEYLPPGFADYRLKEKKSE